MLWNNIEPSYCLEQFKEMRFPRDLPGLWIQLLMKYEGKLFNTYKRYIVTFDFAASLMRTFMFMGFETVTPGHELCPNNGNFIFMVYTID